MVVCSGRASKQHIGSTVKPEYADVRVTGNAADLADSCGLKSFPFHGRPNVVAAQVLPKALEPPDHMQLAVGKMFQKAATHEPRYILPVVVPFVGDFLLQDRADGNQRGKGIPEKQELHEEFPAQRAQTSGENNRYDPSYLNYGSQQLKEPQVRKRKPTYPAVTPLEEHVPGGPQHV